MLEGCGDVAGALADYEVLLADHLRTHGPDHPVILTLRHTRALVLGQGGDFSGAVHELRECLAARERMLGPDHPDTMSTRSYCTCSGVTLGISRQ